MVFLTSSRAKAKVAHFPRDNVVNRVPVAQRCLPRPSRLRRREGLGRRERLLQEALRPGHIVVAERGTAPRRGRHHKLHRNSPIINMVSTVLFKVLNLVCSHSCDVVVG